MIKNYLNIHNIYLKDRQLRVLRSSYKRPRSDTILTPNKELIGFQIKFRNNKIGFRKSMMTKSFGYWRKYFVNKLASFCAFVSNLFNVPIASFFYFSFLYWWYCKVYYYLDLSLTLCLLPRWSICARGHQLTFRRERIEVYCIKQLCILYNWTGIFNM